MTPFEVYRRAQHYIDQGLIRRGPTFPPSRRTRRQWMTWWLPQLGNPQLAYPAIHVAGSSGKGSVCAMVAELMRCSTCRVGLHISPFVQVATEKLWLDGRLASANEFDALVAWLKPFAEAIRADDVPLHGMASVALCLEYFRRQAANVVVMETGVGGKNDLTTVVKTEVAVLTNVGLDHIKTLGPTIEDIAEHKVGIIQPGCTVILHDVDGPLIEAAHRRAHQIGATLKPVPRNCYTATPGPDGHALFSYDSRSLKISDVRLAMGGQVQADNAALSIAAYEAYCTRHALEIADATKVTQALTRARLPARIEKMPGGRVVIDGGHNPDKIKALLETLGEKTHLVFGALQSKSPIRLLEKLAPHVSALTLTEPAVYAKAAQPVETLHPIVPHAHIRRNPLDAVEHAVACASADTSIVVTGSLYLAGQIRHRWYPDDAVVAQRSSWFD